MPLIVITGLPTSGKSTRARQLYDYLAQRIQDEAAAATTTTQQQPGQPRYRLHLISDSTLSIPRSAYDLSPREGVPAHARSANAAEKDARAAAYAAVKRALSPRDLVVLDGLNYIKGWRYQLYCEAKNLGTPNALLQVGCSVERARRVNAERLRRREERRRRGEGGGEGEGEEKQENGEAVEEEKEKEEEEPYEPENWENLVVRYEEPNPMARWDSPLFALVWDDDEPRAREVFAALWEAVAGDGARRAVKPNKVVLPRGGSAAAGGDYLYVLDRETQDVVRRVLELQEQQGQGEEVRVPRGSSSTGSEGDLAVQLPPAHKVGLPQLQRYRRAFVGLNRGGIGLEDAGAMAVARIRESFVGYLNDAFEKEG